MLKKDNTGARYGVTSTIEVLDLREKKGGGDV